jgi:hypothetical protein
MSDEKTISVPIMLSVPSITVLGWMSMLEVAIAAEYDAARPGMAKVLGEIRSAMGRLFPPGCRLHEERE